MAFKAGAIYGEATLDHKKFSGGLKTITKATAIAGAAIAAAFSAAFVKSVKVANEFQKAMSNVSTLVDTTKINMQGLAKQVLLLNPVLGDSTEITKGLYQAFSAGAADAEEAMKITTDAAMFAKAALTDTFTAVDVLTTAVNAYGKETMTTTKAADLFFNTIKFGKVTGAELAASIGASIPLYASAGIALEELTAGIAAMTKQGVNAHVATTQLNQIVTAFLKPSEDMIAALQELGYESGSAFLEAEGLAGGLKLIEDNTAGDAAEMAKLLPNIRALRGAMALTGVGGKEFTRVLEEQGKALGVNAEAFAKQEKTFVTFKNSITNLMTPIGNIGKHFVDKIAVGATQAAQGMLAFIMSSQGMELVANIASYVAGGFELIKGIITPLFEAIKTSVTDAWEPLKEVLAELTDETGKGAGAMKLLSVVINIGVSAVTVIGKVIADQIKLLRDWIIAIKESGATIDTFFKFLKGEADWQDVKDQAKSAFDSLLTLGESSIKSIAGLYVYTIDEIKNASGEAEDLATELTGKVNIAFTKSGDYIRSNWGELLTGQEDFIGDILAGMQQLGLGIQVQTEDDTGGIQTTWFDFWDALIEKGDKTYKELKLILQTSFNDSIISQKEYTELSTELWRNNWDWQIEKVQLAYDTISAITSTTFGGIAAIRSQFYENQSAELELWYQAESSRLQQNFDNQIITEDQFNAEKENLETEAAEKRNTLAEKIFESDKKNRIVSVLSDAASAIMGWWNAASRLGPIAGPIFAGVMTGLTVAMSAAQIAAISQEKFVPSMQTGGMASGLTRINERGGEMIQLPDGSLVIPNDISQQIAKSGGSSSPIIHVSFDGANINSDIDLNRITDQVVKKIGRELRLAI